MSSKTHGVVITPNGEAIREARIRALLTQAELAEKSGTTSFQVHRIETGKQRASIGMLRSIADVLKADVNVFIDWSDI